MDTTSSGATACAQTTAKPDQSKTFVFTHSNSATGVEDTSDSPFAHVRGVTVHADPSNIESLTITITDEAGTTVATITDLSPGSTCGIDHDFEPGDYSIESSAGDGTQFTSFADRRADTSPSSSSTASSVDGQPTAADGQATLTYNGTTYQFTNGRCSSVLDPDQFVFRDPPMPGTDATYFAVVVTDVNGSSSTGGTHAGAVTYQQDGALLVTVSDATLQIAPDLSGGTFTGNDFISGKQATGSYSC
jgi:hypothetical protein